ncbi:MAG TPA: hypothetical protein VGC05_18025 [Mycobacterium sp.]
MPGGEAAARYTASHAKRASATPLCGLNTRISKADVRVRDTDAL